jgi:hypothetical protein
VCSEIRPPRPLLQIFVQQLATSIYFPLPAFTPCPSKGFGVSSGGGGHIIGKGSWPEWRTWKGITVLAQ